MKTNIMEVITYKKQTSKTKHIIELNIGNFFSEKKKKPRSIQENTVFIWVSTFLQQHNKLIGTMIRNFICISKYLLKFSSNFFC